MEQEQNEVTVQPRTRVWVAVDIAADGPDAMVFVEEILSEGQDKAQGNLIGWRVINPASDADKEEFARVGEELTRTFEIEGPMESMFAEEADNDGASKEGA